MSKMDLGKLTQMELLDLRREVNEAIENYSNREKVKVYTIFITFDGTEYYLDKNNAINRLKEIIEDTETGDDSSLFELKIVLDSFYVTQADVEKYCRDFKKQQS